MRKQVDQSLLRLQCLSRTRFEAITRFLRFDSKVDRAERQERKKLVPIQVIFDKMAVKFRVSFSPGETACVDEQLLVYRGRCPFKIYLPSNPGKGIKLWICANVETSYILCEFRSLHWETRSRPRDQPGRDFYRHFHYASKFFILLS